MVRGFTGRGQTEENVNETKGIAKDTLPKSLVVCGEILGWQRLADIGQKAWIGGTATGIVCFGICQRQLAIDRKMNLIALVRLPIVLPPADGAQLQSGRDSDCPVSAAGAGISYIRL